MVPFHFSGEDWTLDRDDYDYIGRDRKDLGRDGTELMGMYGHVPMNAPQNRHAGESMLTNC